MKPEFSNLDNIFISRFGSEERYQLVPISEVETSEQNISRIYHICNEPEVYNWHFSPVNYTPEKARGFLDWGKAGWREDTHYVFLIMDTDMKIAGAIDIKSADLHAGEIGYWVSSTHKGIASSALQKKSRSQRVQDTHYYMPGQKKEMIDQ